MSTSTVICPRCKGKTRNIHEHIAEVHGIELVAAQLAGLTHEQVRLLMFDGIAKNSCTIQEAYALLKDKEFDLWDAPDKIVPVLVEDGVARIPDNGDKGVALLCSQEAAVALMVLIGKKEEDSNG